MTSHRLTIPGTHIPKGACGLPLILAMAATATLRAGAPPANDDCSDARLITVGETPFSTAGATTDGPGVCGPMGRDVWFKFRSTFTGPLLVSTCDDADFDTVIAVYSGCGCDDFSLVGCNDDASGCDERTSRVIVSVDADKCYRIRVGGFGGETGLGVLTLLCANPQNAACADHILSGFETDDRFGQAVCGGGNFNGDSFDDVLIGAPRHDVPGLNAGRAYADRGANLSALYTLSGAAAGDLFGFAVACNCDVNDDGRADMLIGAPLNDGGGLSSGHVYAYSGFDGALLWDRAGSMPGDRLGHSVACAGDVNNDGFEDVIVGAPFSDAGGVNAGQAYVLDGEDGSVLFTRNGQMEGELFGWAVAGIGDLDDDERDDFAVGAPKNSGAGTNAGRVSLFSGHTGSVLKRISGDSSGDKFGSSVAGLRFTGATVDRSLIIVGAPNHDAGSSNTGRAKVYQRDHLSPGQGGCNGLVCLLYVIDGGNRGDRFGSSVAIGDVVGNSFPDFLVGAPKADFNGSSSGAAYIFDGGNGTLARRFFGEAPGDNFGRSVSLAGDVNNGGDTDVIIGAPLNDAGGAKAGRAYVFLMGDSSESAVGAADLTSTSLVEMASDGVRFIDARSASACPGDFNGDALVGLDDLQSVFNGPASDPDAVIDIEELLVLLTHWGPCP